MRGGLERVMTQLTSLRAAALPGRLAPGRCAGGARAPTQQAQPWGAAASSSGSSSSSSGRRRHSIAAAAALPASPGAAAAAALPPLPVQPLQLVGPPQPNTGDYGISLPPGGQRLILADAMAVLYRAHYAFGEANRLRTQGGEDTSVLFGFLSTLLSLLELQPQPTHLAVVFDAAGKNFRHEIYRGYKGQRPETPDAVRAAVPRIKAILAAMGIPQLQVAGVEADDAIGTLAVRAVEEGMVVAIASPDKDFFQLLRPNLMLLRPPRKGVKPSKYMLVPFTEDTFRQEWELEPAQFVDLLALAGDASDNVPGVKGIGPKTAIALLRQYGTLGEVLTHAAEAKPKRAAEGLTSPEGQAAAQLSRQLVEIRTDLDFPPLRAPLDELRLQLPPDAGAAALREFKALEFRTHATRLKQLWARSAGS